WGGPALTDADQDAALTALGFTTPTDRRDETEVHSSFRIHLPADRPESADRAADLAVAALAILGVQPTDHLARDVS
ncbi:MAG: TY-Chap domain-containing protein, partial [Nocardioides sp.]